MPDATETLPDVEEKSRLSPMWRVLIHNDDVPPMDFVVDVLVRIFAREPPRAVEIMFEAHHTGVAHVVTEPLERAEFHIEQARSLARGRGHPLTFTCEPE